MNKRYAFQITIRDGFRDGELTIELKNISGYEFDPDLDEATAAIVVMDAVIERLSEEGIFIEEGATHDA